MLTAMETRPFSLLTDCSTKVTTEDHHRDPVRVGATDLDDDVLAQIYHSLGDYYFPIIAVGDCPTRRPEHIVLVLVPEEPDDDDQSGWCGQDPPGGGPHRRRRHRRRDNPIPGGPPRRARLTAVNWSDDPSAWPAACRAALFKLFKEGTLPGTVAHAWNKVRSALRAICAAAATCRRWSQALDVHWPTIYRTIEKYFHAPWSTHRADALILQEILNVPSPPLPPAGLSSPEHRAWCRLAVKLFCKDGSRMARRMACLKPHPARVVPEAHALYVVRDLRTNERRVLLGTAASARHSSGHVVIEGQLKLPRPLLIRHGRRGRRQAESSLPSIEEVDREVARRAQVWQDTLDMTRALRKIRRQLSLQPAQCSTSTQKAEFSDNSG